MSGQSQNSYMLMIYDYNPYDKGSALDVSNQFKKSCCTNEEINAGLSLNKTKKV